MIGNKRNYRKNTLRDSRMEGNMRKCPCCGEDSISSKTLSSIWLTGKANCPSCNRKLKVKRNAFVLIPLIYTFARSVLRQFFQIQFDLGIGWEMSIVAGLYLIAIWKIAIQEDKSAEA